MVNLNENQEDLIQDKEINLLDIFQILWDKKVFITLLTSLIALISILYALSLPNIYQSQALLSVSDDSQSNMGMLGQYSSMARMAGFSLPTANGDKSLEAIERVKSYEFFSKFFLPMISLQDLMATSEWDSSSNRIIYDNENFDPDTIIWLKGQPSSQKAYKKYQSIMNISQNRKTSFITVSIKHHSPYVAKEWTDIIIQQINNSMRDEEKNRIMKSIEFLNAQALKVNFEEIKEAITFLQQEQIKSLMLIESNENHIFKILNSPIVPELKSEPSRKEIVILGTLLGILISIAFVFITYLFPIKSKD
jgi:uncharacterized protein involved in exopolysaccharide biosynthesis